MPRYIDGFVLPLRKDRVDQYRSNAEIASQVWQDHGALEYWECLGDDLAATPETSNFPAFTGAAEDETVVFAWALFESREARDAANEKIMADPRLAEMMAGGDPGFDCKRMAFGGFNVMVNA